MKKILIGIGLFATLFLGACRSSSTYRAPVNGASGSLIMHPDSVTMIGKDGKTYYLLYNITARYLFITSNKEIFDNIARYLPPVVASRRAAYIDGPIINPFTLFKKRDLNEESKRIGLQLNKFRVCRIFNYALSTY